MGFDYSLNNALDWGNFSYHYEKAQQGSFSLYSIFHTVLAALEFLPVVGQSISLVEYGIVRLVGIVRKKDKSNLENDAIVSIAANVLKISKDQDPKSAEKQQEILSNSSINDESSTKSSTENLARLSTFSEKEQTKIITVAEVLANNLTGHFHRGLLGKILLWQDLIQKAREENISDLTEEEIDQRNQLINKREERIEYLFSKNQNLKSSVRTSFENYFIKEISKNLKYGLIGFYFEINDYHPLIWVTDILHACFKLENIDKETIKEFRHFFPFTKHEFFVSATLDSYEEIYDGRKDKIEISKIKRWEKLPLAKNEPAPSA